MNCKRHTFLSQYNNAAISSHVFAHSIHFQLFLFSVIHCTSSEERHLEGAASEERSHETTSEEPILSPSDTPFKYVFIFQTIRVSWTFFKKFTIRSQKLFSNINRRRFNNFDIKFRQDSYGRNFTPSFQGKYLCVPAPRPRFYFFSFMANVLRIAFVHSLQLKRWWHFLFPSRAFWYFHVYLSSILWEVNSFFPTRHQSLSSANEIILYFGSNITTWKFISSADTILSCEFASMLTAQFVRLRSTFTNFLCNAAYYSARALYQCYGWSFIHFTNVLRGIVMGLSSRTSALSTQLSTLEMFVYRQFIFIFSQISTYICGPYQILTILFKLQRL